MPLIKSAIKKVRKDRIRTARNNKRRNELRTAIKSARQKPSVKSLAKTFSLLDKAAKFNLIHANKAARIKSRLSKLLVR